MDIDEADERHAPARVVPRTVEKPVEEETQSSASVGDEGVEKPTFPSSPFITSAFSPLLDFFLAPSTGVVVLDLVA